MTSKVYRDFINANRISDGVLRENVLQGNYKEAVMDCETAIARRVQEINALKILQNELREEKP